MVNDIQPTTLWMGITPISQFNQAYTINMVNGIQPTTLWADNPVTKNTIQPSIHHQHGQWHSTNYIVDGHHPYITIQPSKHHQHGRWHSTNYIVGGSSRHEKHNTTKYTPSTWSTTFVYKCILFSMVLAGKSPNTHTLNNLCI